MRPSARLEPHERSRIASLVSQGQLPVSPLDPAELFTSLATAAEERLPGGEAMLLSSQDTSGDQPLDPGRFRRPTSLPPHAAATSQPPLRSMRARPASHWPRTLALAALLAVALAAAWLLTALP